MTQAQPFVPFPAEFVARYREAGLWGTLTIAGELRAVAARYPDHEAVVTVERRLTYAELDARSDAIAATLAAHGIGAGDPVVLQIGNTAESVEALYGLIRAGAIPICSLVPFGHHEIDAIADITQAKAHLVQADIPNRDLVAFARRVREVTSSIEHILTIRGAAPDAVRLDDAPPVDRDDVPDDSGDPDGIAIFQLSGGTTGTPKVIPRLHAEYWYNARATAQRYGYTTEERIGHFLPLVHNAGLHAAVFPAHSVGATLVLGPTWAPPVVLDLLERERVTFLGTMTSLVPTIIDEPAFDAATRSLRRLNLAVPAVPRELFDQLSARGINVCQFYGMSEGFVCSMPSDACEEMRSGTVGFPLSELDEFRVIDPETGEATKPEDAGELWVRGPYTLRGYFGAAEYNAQAFSRDGFLRTGDLVTRHEIEGRTCLRIVGRHKDLISRGGEKINASEIESLLVQLPGVEAAALVGMPDDRLGERPCAFLVADPISGPNLLAVKEFLAERGVAKYKWPERVELIAELPMTAVGKVSKVLLREELMRRLAAATDAEQQAQPVGTQGQR